MKLSLGQTEKTRQEYAEETIAERMAMADLTTQIVSAELGKMRILLVDMKPEDKANLIAYATQLAFTIARAVTAEDIRRHGEKIDHV